MEKKINKKTEKLLILLWKISIIIAGLSLLLLLFVASDLLKLILFIMAMLFGGIMFFIQSLDGKYVELIPPTYACKINIKFNNYEEVLEQFLKKLNYNKGNIKVNDEIYGTVFYDVKRHWYNFFGKEIFFIFVVNMKEYNNDTLHLIIDKFEENIGDYVGKFTYNDYVEFTLVTCLNNSNKPFLKYIDQDVFQENNRIKLPVGIVFSENKMFISTQKSLMFKKRYEKLKKNIIDIFND